MTCDTDRPPVHALALATDFDGTLARQGRVDGPTLSGLQRWQASGRRLILVTGRELPELLGVFQDVAVCDLVVAENGALLYRPGDRSERLLAPPPPDEFIVRLSDRGVGPISVGRTIVATWQPHQDAVREVIREMGLDLDVILNKRAVMVLPRGVNKGSGLLAALHELGLSPADVVGVGDAENDLDFLSLCGLSAAVANALDVVKCRVDRVTAASHGEGVVELIDRLDSR